MNVSKYLASEKRARDSIRDYGYAVLAARAGRKRNPRARLERDKAKLMDGPDPRSISNPKNTI